MVALIAVFLDDFLCVHADTVHVDCKQNLLGHNFKTAVTRQAQVEEASIWSG